MWTPYTPSLTNQPYFAASCENASSDIRTPFTSAPADRRSFAGLTESSLYDAPHQINHAVTAAPADRDNQHGAFAVNHNPNHVAHQDGALAGNPAADQHGALAANHALALDHGANQHGAHSGPFSAAFPASSLPLMSVPCHVPQVSNSAVQALRAADLSTQEGFGRGGVCKRERRPSAVDSAAGQARPRRGSVGEKRDLVGCEYVPPAPGDCDDHDDDGDGDAGDEGFNPAPTSAPAALLPGSPRLAASTPAARFHAAPAVKPGSDAPAALAAAAPAAGPIAGLGLTAEPGGVQGGAARRRLGMSREERKREDLEAAARRINETMGSLGDVLLQAIGEVMYYPCTEPGRPPEARSILGDYLPAGTATDLASLRKTRDPHVHYAFFRSEELFVDRVVECWLQDQLPALRRFLLSQIRLYRYRLCNNCRKTWTGPVDLQRAPASPFVQRALNSPAIVNRAPATNHGSLAPPAPMAPRPTEAASVNPQVPAPGSGAGGFGGGGGGAPLAALRAQEPASSSWCAAPSALMVPALRKDGRPDSELRSRGLISFVQPKPPRNPPKKSRRSRKLLRSAAVDPSLERDATARTATAAAAARGGPDTADSRSATTWASAPSIASWFAPPGPVAAAATASSMVPLATFGPIGPAAVDVSLRAPALPMSTVGAQGPVALTSFIHGPAPVASVQLSPCSTLFSTPRSTPCPATPCLTPYSSNSTPSLSDSALTPGHNSDLGHVSLSSARGSTTTSKTRKKSASHSELNDERPPLRARFNDPPSDANPS
jgi:hypothetical protein